MTRAETQAAAAMDEALTQMEELLAQVESLSPEEQAEGWPPDARADCEKRLRRVSSGLQRIARGERKQPTRHRPRPRGAGRPRRHACSRRRVTRGSPDDEPGEPEPPAGRPTYAFAHRPEVRA